MIKLTATHYWRIMLGISILGCLAVIGLIWLSGKNETESALKDGQRLLITLETGAIEGKQALSDKSDAKPEGKGKTEGGDKKEDTGKKPDTAPADDTKVKEAGPETAPVAPLDKPAPPKDEAPAAAPPKIDDKPAAEPVSKEPAPKESAPSSSDIQPPATTPTPAAEAAPPAPKPTSAASAPDTTISTVGVISAGAALAPVKESLTEKGGAGFLPTIDASGVKPWRHYSKHYTHKTKLPVIAIVITGLGQNKNVTDMAVRLPENFSLSFSPYAKDFAIWTNAARVAGHEVLIDLPLEPSNFPATDPGPNGLLVSNGNEMNTKRLEWLMSRGQGYVGFLTPQNDAFTADAESAKNLTNVLGKRGLMLLMGHEPAKSETVDLLNASKTAYGIADLLIDEELATTAIQARLLTLEKLASKRGYAVGVAQAFPLSIQQLNEWSAQLQKDGYEVVPITYIIGLKFVT